MLTRIDMGEQRLFLIFHGRFPSEKAAALFAAHTADAFVAIGARVTVLAPRRLGRSRTGAREQYRLAQNFDVVYLPTLDLFSVPVLRLVAYYVSLFVFSISAYAYLLFKANRADTIYSNEMFPLLFATTFFRHTCYELHDYPEHNRFFYGLLFRRVARILVTNKWKLERLQKDFPRAVPKAFLEPNAVSITDFDIPITQSEARTQLDLPQTEKIILYTGHLYSWKGVEVLAQAAQELPSEYTVYFVGGTPKDVEAFTKKWGSRKNIRIIGHRPHTEVPLWQKAADVLVLPNTAKEAISQFYTSPMKLFEYMASGTPVVASNLPSIVEILNDERGVLVEPDNSKALAQAIVHTLTDAQAHARAQHAQAWVADHTWEKRAARILEKLG